MFYQTNDGIFINLDNVSYVSFTNAQAVMIFNYTVALKHINVNGVMKRIGDYHYIKDSTEFERLRQACTDLGFREVRTDSQHLLINPRNVSTIKRTSKYVVVNFCTPVTFTDKKSGNSSQLTAQFVYIDTSADAESIINQIVS